MWRMTIREIALSPEHEIIIEGKEAVDLVRAVAESDASITAPWLAILPELKRVRLVKYTQADPAADGWAVGRNWYFETYASRSKEI